MLYTSRFRNVWLRHSFTAVVVPLLAVGGWNASLCRSNPPVPSSTNRSAISTQAYSNQTDATPIFQQYGLISTQLESAILDNFAIQLINDQNLTGYVILRRGQYSSKFAGKRLIRIRNYLVKRRRVPASRVSVLEGKRRGDFTVELYLVPKGKARPV